MSKLPDGFGRIPDLPPFGDRLNAMVAMELSAAHGDGERLAEMVERLIRASGFAIATISRGNAEAMSNFLQGAEAYLYESAADNARFGGLFETLKRSSPAQERGE